MDIPVRTVISELDERLAKFLYANKVRISSTLRSHMGACPALGIQKQPHQVMLAAS